VGVRTYPLSPFPPQSTTKSRYSEYFYQFLEVFQSLISSLSTSDKFLVTGNFNIIVDDFTDSNAFQFLFICLLKIINSPTAPRTECLARAIRAIKVLSSVMTFFLLVSLLTLLQYFPILSTAVQLSLVFLKTCICHAAAAATESAIADCRMRRGWDAFSAAFTAERSCHRDSTSTFATW